MWLTEHYAPYVGEYFRKALVKHGPYTSTRIFPDRHTKLVQTIYMHQLFSCEMKDTGRTNVVVLPNKILFFIDVRIRVLIWGLQFRGIKRTNSCFVDRRILPLYYYRGQYLLGKYFRKQNFAFVRAKRRCT